MEKYLFLLRAVRAGVLTFACRFLSFSRWIKPAKDSKRLQRLRVFSISRETLFCPATSECVTGSFAYYRGCVPVRRNAELQACCLARVSLSTTSLKASTWREASPVYAGDRAHSQTQPGCELSGLHGTCGPYPATVRARLSAVKMKGMDGVETHALLAPGGVVLEHHDGVM
jgi:hypothetical protein